MKNHILALSLGLFGLVLSSSGHATSSVTTSPRVDRILAGMTLDDKISQMMMSYPPVSETDPITVGAVIFTGNLLKSEESVRKRVQDLQSRAKVPLFVAADVEGGRLNKLGFVEGLESVPANKDISTEEAAQQWGYRVGVGMKGLGLNMALAPVLDSADSGVMADTGRSFGGDPETVGRLGRAYSRGLGGAGVVAVGKHWPGYGSLAKNTDHHFVVTERAEQEVQRHARAFVLVGDEMTGVMLANVGYSSFGSKPAILSSHLVDWAHDHGWLTMTDDLSIEMLAQATNGDQEEVVRQAFLAGNDILLTTAPIDWNKALDYRGLIREMVEREPYLESRVDDSVRRILMAKDRLGLLY